VATARLLNAMPAAALPAPLRDRVLGTAAAPELGELRETIAMRADPPPEPETAFEPEPERRGPRLWPVFAAVACVLVIVCGVFLLLPGSGQEKTSGQQPITAPSESPTADDGLPSDSAEPEPSSDSPSPKPSKSSKTPTPTPSTTKPHTHHPSPSSPQRPGTLSVSGCHMSGTRHCSVTVTAKGGPVSWSVSGTSGSIDAGGSGSLGAGQSDSVTVSRTDSFCFGSGSGSVTFSSGASASVTWSC
ncbi:hypothetical protein ACFFNX_40595, partial [Actinoallomurus acaciae]